MNRVRIPRTIRDSDDAEKILQKKMFILEVVLIEIDPAWCRSNDSTLLELPIIETLIVASRRDGLNPSAGIMVF